MKFPLVCLLNICLCVSAEEAPQNLARGKVCSFSRKPTYPYSRDPDDEKQLTDGVYSNARGRPKFWTQLSTVGWYATNGTPIFITLDLGKINPISGLSVNMGAGNSEVRWPLAIVVFVSNDGKTWHEAGDLVSLSNRDNPPPPYGKYGGHRFITNELQTEGRHVKLAVLPSPHYAFIDEIEVFRGKEGAKTAKGAAIKLADIETLVSQRIFLQRLKRQLLRDLAAVRDDINSLEKNAAVPFTQKADDLLARIDRMPPVPMETFKAILPMTDLERNIFRLQAEVWRAQKKPSLRVWKNHRWDPLEPSGEPSQKGPARLDIRMMQNEHRADVFNLTNAADKDVRVEFEIRGLPGGVNPPSVSVHEVMHLGTKDHGSIAAPLPIARLEDGKHRALIPAGMTRQVWLTVSSKNLSHGVHAGEVVGKTDSGEAFRIPIRVQVFPLRFPDSTTLLLSGWDYTDCEAIYGLTPQNREQVIKHLHEHYVNVTWGSTSAMQYGRFDEAGNLIETPKTRLFDEWVKHWPKARLYMVFRNLANGQFAGSDFKSDHFRKKVGAWTRFWSTHVKKLGLKPKQLGFLPVDEPHSDRAYAINTAFAEAVHKVEPDFIMFTEPTPKDTEAFRTMMSHLDILCAHWMSWMTQKETYRPAFLQEARKGKQIWFYNVPPLSDSECLLDPYPNFLLRAWHCFDEGVAGSAFWCFIDTGTVSIWNPYHAKAGRTYCPFYLEKDRLMPGKYMEAIREGVEDYEYLVMLQRRIQELEESGASPGETAKARQILKSTVDDVVGNVRELNVRAPYGPLDWREDQDRSRADRARVKVLEMLVSLSK